MLFSLSFYCSFSDVARVSSFSLDRNSLLHPPLSRQAGRFTDPKACDPPTRPDRMCGMPWDQRFGIASPNILYTEMHVHNVEYINFGSGTSFEDKTRCIPSSYR